jgi:hyperosmotically inducible periplasmic protein
MKRSPFIKEPKMKRFLLVVFCGLALGCGQNTHPASNNQSTTDKPTTVTTQRPVTTESSEKITEPADRTNTGVNVRDRDNTMKTPTDQNENKADLNTTADIRKRVVDSKMSIDAQNIKIMTQGGKVTLRGPVKTVEEKQKIEEIAKDVAGATSVDSQLEVNTK